MVILERNNPPPKQPANSVQQVVPRIRKTLLPSPTIKMATILPTEPILNQDDLMFTVGSIVECKTCFEEVLIGEVLAFEYNNKILVLKSPSASTSNITCLNLEYCGDIRIIKEAENQSNNTKLPDMNTNKIEERTKAAIQERNNLIEAYKSGVSSDGISLYLQLIKTFAGAVTLESNEDKGHCIVIRKNTKILPPYNVDCVQATMGKTGGMPMSAEAVNYAKQLVEKFWRDQNKDPYTLVPFSSNTGSGVIISNNISKNNSKVEQNSVAKLSSPPSSGSPTPINTIAAAGSATTSSINTTEITSSFSSSISSTTNTINSSNDKYLKNSRY